MYYVNLRHIKCFLVMVQLHNKADLWLNGVGVLLQLRNSQNRLTFENPATVDSEFCNNALLYFSLYLSLKISQLCAHKSLQNYTLPFGSLI